MAHRTEAPGTRRWSLWRELPMLFVVALLLALLIKAFVVQSFRIPSGSMEDTLRIGDWVLVNKMVYHFRGVDRGDIVVFNGQGSWDPPVRANSSQGLAPRLYHDVLRWVGLETDGTDYIKRVIGLPGDHVMCCDSDGHITVNGVPLSEGSYLYPGSDPSVQQFKIVVPPGRVWVMGDHRADSADSRYHMEGPGDGTIPLDRVVGRAFVIFWPLSQLQTLPIPGTFKQSELLSREISGRRAAMPMVPLVGALGVVAPGLWLPRRFRRFRRRGGPGCDRAVCPRFRRLPRRGGPGCDRAVCPRFRRLPRRGSPGRARAVCPICEHEAVSISGIAAYRAPRPGHGDRYWSRTGISSLRWMRSSCDASLRWRGHPSPGASRRPGRRNVTGATIRPTLRTRGMSR